MKSEKGFALIETLVSLALLGIIAVGFLSALSTTLAAATVSQGRTTAESLAKSQLEHIKAQDYIPTDNYTPGNPDSSYELTDVPADIAERGYTLEINAPVNVVSPCVGQQSELQSITIVVKRNGRTIPGIIPSPADIWQFAGSPDADSGQYQPQLSSGN